METNEGVIQPERCGIADDEAPHGDGNFRQPERRAVKVIADDEAPHGDGNRVLSFRDRR